MTCWTVFIALAAGFLTLDLLAAAIDPAVKLSKAGICHDAASASYAITKNFKAFTSLDECMKSGGRLPRNRRQITASKAAEASPSIVDNQDSVNSERGSSSADSDRLSHVAFIGVAGASLGIIVAAGLYVRRRLALSTRSAGTRSEVDLERQRWEGHKRESANMNDMKRTPVRRQDPWLQRIGYFKQRKK